MDRPIRHRAGFVLALVGIIAFGSLMFMSPLARAGAAVVFSEDFESGSLASRWSATDTDSASGLDYWGISNARNHTGLYSAWAAQIGNQSTGPNAGQNNSDVGEYDDNMQADLSIDLRVNGYTTLTLSFWYFSKTESGGGDWIQAWYEAGGVQTIIFTNVGSTGNKWDPVNISVPNDIDRLILRFHSDTANHGFEGAYVDNIVMTGIESTPPESNALSLPTYANTDPVPVAYVAQDNTNASGVDYVELWYRYGTSGNFTLYTSSGNVTQWRSSPIPFVPPAVLGDGLYEFYTIAVDRAQNRESPPAGRDVSVTIDRSPPSLVINEPASGAWSANATVVVSWQASDAVSGLDRYETSLDGSAFASNGIAGSKAFTDLAEGPHAVIVRAYDRAGNMASVGVGFNVDTTRPTVLISSPASGEFLTTGTVTLTWTVVEETSGIDHYEVWLDDGPHAVTLDKTLVFEPLGDGPHTLNVVAYDRAGNAGTATVSFVVDTNPFSLTGPYRGLPLFLLLAIVIALLVFLLFWWKRRKDKEEERKTHELEAQPARQLPESGQKPESVDTGIPPPETAEPEHQQP